MKIALGSDHRGDHAAATLTEHLRRGGHDVVVLGETGTGSRDYPDSAWLVGRAVAEGNAERGVLICGSGNGVAIAANKIPGVRAGIACDVETAALARQHNDANVLCIGSDRLDAGDIHSIVDRWIEAEFEGGRHARRVRKIEAIEQGRDPTEADVKPGTAL